MNHLTAYTLWRPKAGNADDEYEDAFYSAKRPGSAARIALAIADGATESLLSRQWANLLVKRFVRQWQRPENLEYWLANTWRAWQREKREYIRRRERAGKPIQWYEEPGLQAGAFAALLGVVLTRAPQGLAWRAVALGDCCLVQVRDNVMGRAFPIENADAFHNRPFLLGSHPARNAAEHFRFAEGTLARGDRMYLMTDALAAWFLRAHEQGAQPWQELDAFCAAEAFAAWLTEKRAAHAMRNDDVTLMRLAWE
jgi:hypothetical protein